MNRRDLEDAFTAAISRGLKPLQDQDEMGIVVQQILYMCPEAKIVVELGVANGGWLYLVHRLCPSVEKLIGIDIDLSKVGENLALELLCGKDNKLFLVDGDSRESETVHRVERLLNGRTIDVLHIDALHAYDTAKKNFENYAPYVREGGLIIFHDVRVKSKKGCAMFFREVMFDHFHILAHQKDESKRGIGILKMTGKTCDDLRMEEEIEEKDDDYISS